jgi:hypothetical protein
VAAQIADRLPQMNPRDEIAADGTWCLADSDRTWLFYSLHGGEIRLAPGLAGQALLHPGAGGRTAVWFNPRNGAISAATLDTGPAIAKPTNEAWVLLIKANS